MKLALVGAGASAVALLDGISRAAAPPPERITVFDPAERPWCGRPYGDDLASVRVNILPEHMSVRSGESGHFSAWLRSRGMGGEDLDFAAADRFPPRRVYGRYLSETAGEAAARLKERGCRVELVRQRVVSAFTLDGEGVADDAGEIGGVWLSTTTGGVSRADRVVLAVGAGRPADHYGLTGTEGFHPDPYPLERTLRRIDSEADVAVLGTGLAAVDTAVSLLAAGHRGRVVMASRSGSLPAVRQTPAEVSLTACAPEMLRGITADGRRLGLDDVARLLAGDIRAEGGDPGSLLTEIEAVECEPAARRLRRQLGRIGDPDPGVRLAQKAIPASGPDLWVRLTPEAQRLVRTRYHRVLQSLCCPVPPGNARILLEAIDSGRLTVHSGLWNAKPTAVGGVDVFTDDGVFHAAEVVNAVAAPSHRNPPRAKELVDGLVSAGLAERHPAGGLSVDPDTSRALAPGRAESPVFVIGDLAAGTLYFTSGMPSVVDRAANIARALAADSADTRRTAPLTAARRDAV